MSIKNDMERLVRAEVARRAKAAGTGSTVCWCPLCETDIVALALNLLPPLYCRAETFGHAAVQVGASAVRDAVQTALTRVAISPKHLPGGWPATVKDAALVNYTYEVGATLVGAATDHFEAGCSCAACRFDTLAYALNRYPPRYGVARGGRRRLQANDLDFMRHELGVLLTQAARVVSSHPHH